jgi:hypothetical protein
VQLTEIARKKFKFRLRKPKLLTFANKRGKYVQTVPIKQTSTFARIQLNTNYMAGLICAFWHSCCRTTIRNCGKDKKERLYLGTKEIKGIVTLYIE